MRGLYNRHVSLGAPMPEMFVADNCCHVRSAIQKVFPGAHVCLDVYHLLGRYLAVVLNGTKNPYRGEVAKDVVDSILKNRAGKDGHRHARYYNRTEQEHRLKEMYEKWARKGGVWSFAAAKVHADQLAHVQKGCLERTREDLACDGSRIEGSHKSWNHIMRSFPSGIVVFTSLGHDLVLRRDLRLAAAIHYSSDTLPAHLLSNKVNHTWNTLAGLAKSKAAPRPVLRTAAVYEVFGLVPSEHNSTFGGLLQVKEEWDEEAEGRSLEDEVTASRGTISYLNIDPSDLDRPLPTTSTPSSSSSTSTSTLAPWLAPLCQLTRHQALRVPASAAQSLDTALLSPLSPPPDSNPGKLTPSERLFLAATSINIRSLKISDDVEFFTFMDLREKCKWTSFGMTSRMWTPERCRAQGLPEPLPKHPRALVEKLGEVETKIVRRLATNDFKSKRSGGEDFWKRHCSVISLVKRKAPACVRCKQMKYPGGTGSAANHRRDYCSDGVRCGLKAGVTDVLPDWPQPAGIFTNGSKFHAIEFLKAIRDLHEKTMFQARTIKADDSAGGMYLFRLFDYLEMTPALPELVVKYNGETYLRLDCLGGGSSASTAGIQDGSLEGGGEGGDSEVL
ncbi:hypothetical protein OH76DRAFT_1456744 [Lentinus brumalis]|uniref:Uncharacterized protein n=1 Tax=Lentinus brumalis TaxID=2498619 RepID=A0A371D4R4_9APHY|nr:hypothetical protein OH76DRAFT_1456744 [Polyporus brumalis]